MPNSYQLKEEDLIALQSKTIHERIKWIRTTASKENNGLYKQSKVAEDIGVTASTLAKLESGYAKNPSLDVLQKLSKYFSIPISAFFDVYYEDSVEQFTIFGSNDEQLNKEPLFKSNYQANISCDIHSLNSDYEVSFNEKLYLSVLELEEFQEEFRFLINKIKNRKKNWSRKIGELNKLKSTTNKGENDEIL
ncbi:helix-turn-helix domain-containing protein [Virgibacillus salexigens]|uniref:helix-turn-helix domain-containing protein n=1 Tax=Virgibacillus salexigens TaxID=61016 RepID=UPI00190CF607|nr:helix-turn-helix transcriptional regulator [Virgibacillus salexigens]